MTYNQRETAREIRLWIRDIIVPAMGLVIISPKAREFMSEKVDALKHRLTKKA